LRKLTKVLSILLAMVLVFSVASIGVEAQYSAYKDVEMVYDSIDQPILSTEQYASMAMDELDRMLMKENITVNEKLLAIEFKLDFSTIDKSLDSVDYVLGKLNASLLDRLGDVGDMDFSALQNCPRRVDAGATDLDIFAAVFQFLADNAGILKKVVDGTVDLGLVGNFVDVSAYLNIPLLVKTEVAKLVYPEVEKADLDLTKTLDQYVAIMIDRVLNGTYPKNKSTAINRITEVAQDYLPGITNKINFLGDSVYDIIEKGVRAVISSGKAVDLANYYMRVALHKFCGYTYTKSKSSDGLTLYTLDKVQNEIKPGYDEYVNVDFTLSPINTDSWGANTTFVDHLNDIVGKVVEAAFTTKAGITWDYSQGNDALLSNIRAAVEKVLEFTGGDLFASYVEVLPIAEVKALNDDEFIAYILRSIMNGSIDSVYITSDVTTTEEVLFETVKSLAAQTVPSEDYSGLSADIDGMIRMGLDMAALGLSGVTSLALDYGLSKDEFAEEAMEWVIRNYGGFVSEVSGSGWEALSNVFFNIIPADWLPYTDDGELRDDLEEIIFDDIVANIMAFDIPAVLNLLSRNPNGELNGTFVEVLMARITGIVNYVIPGVFPSNVDYSLLENLINPATLGRIVEGLFTGLNSRFDTLAVSLLPLACSILDLSSPEEFGYPYVSLEDVTVLDPTMPSFYIFNGSKGINTAWTDKYGNEPQRDELYKYTINSITVDNDDVSVVTDAGTSPAGIIVNGGQSVNFKFTGLTNTTGLLTVVINYDVSGETGQQMTTEPLTTTSYVYVSNKKDDGDNADRRNPTVDNLISLSIKNVYKKVGTKASDLADFNFSVIRDISSQGTSHTLPAKVTLSNVELANSLRSVGVSGNNGAFVNTTENGGMQDISPYLVAEGNENELPEGKHRSVLKVDAEETEFDPYTWEVQHTVWVYNDYGLGGYLSSAVNADRQQINYDTDYHDAEYIPFDSLEAYNDEIKALGDDATDEEREAVRQSYLEVVNDVNGADAWDRYVAAVREAADIMYAPRQANNYDSYVGRMYDAPAELYTAVNELEACSVSSGAAGVKSALNAIIPDDEVPVLDENGQPKYDENGKALMESVPYNDPAHTFFGREDYVNYTYFRFKPEWRAARSVINKWEDGETVSTIEAVYATHRLNLYANRLIRIRAYKEHLAASIQKFTPLYNAGKGDWSTESWTNFETAYQFAVSVNGEAIGSTISGSDNLVNDGLRQSKVNEARGQLIKAAKKLVEGEDVDKTALGTLLNTNKAAYDTNGTGYTAVSFSAFKTAYENARAVYNNADATQAQVDAAYDALSDKASKLEVEQGGGDEGTVEFDEIDGVQPRLTEPTEEFEYEYLVGLSEDWIGSLDSFLILPDGYTFEIEGNESMDEESTGAILHVFNGDGEEVATHTLVLFGEVTGEGEVTLYDVALIMQAANYEDVGGWQDYEATDEFAESFAADITHDGEITPGDAGELIASLTGAQTINQNWTVDGDDTIFYN